jgi:hypothetical protein
MFTIGRRRRGQRGGPKLDSFELMIALAHDLVTTTRTIPAYRKELSRKLGPAWLRMERGVVVIVISVRAL